jgi:hypothetical protein
VVAQSSGDQLGAGVGSGLVDQAVQDRGSPRVQPDLDRDRGPGSAAPLKAREEAPARRRCGLGRERGGEKFEASGYSEKDVERLVDKVTNQQAALGADSEDDEENS